MNELKLPLVSVIIPAYNAAEFTVRTVESILNQTYPAIEVIVVDDGSSDETLKRLEAFGDKIKVMAQENAGACAARNNGYRASKGEFIAFLDCDDMYLSDKIEKCITYFIKHKDVGLVHTDAYYIDENDQILGKGRGKRTHYKGWIKNKLIVYNMVFNPTVVIRRECIEKVGAFDEKLFPPADWDLWLRICEQYKVGFIDECLSKYRVVSNWNFKYLERVYEEEKIVIERFLKRNPKTPKRVANNASSRLHFSMAKSYIAQGDEGAMKQHLLISLARNPLNWKANVMFYYYLFAKNGLKKHAAKTMFVET